MPAQIDVSRHPGIAGLLTGLEPTQLEAVLADDPVVCVLAGAGTGKTRVLTLRVARRVRDQSARPNHALVCTFSRKAADELRDRLWALGVSRDVRAGTFHRTALRLIAHHRHDRGQGPPAIAADRRHIIADVLEGRGARRMQARARTGPRAASPISRQQREIGRLDAEIGWAKSRLVGPADYEEAARRAGRRPFAPAAQVADLYEGYEVARRRRGVLDLDDLLWHCGDLLEQDAAFTRAIRWWHRHLFVDEMQDLNDAQYRLLCLLAGDEPDLFVVGDPNQSVYGWNGADPELLQRVTEEYAGTRVLRLETNHRCAAPIVRVAAAALGAQAPPPSTRSRGPLPVIACLADDEEEARFVARQIWLAHQPGRRWETIAVLARTNAQLSRIADALDREHVPHRTSGAELGPGSDVRSMRAGREKHEAREGYGGAATADDHDDRDDSGFPDRTDSAAQVEDPGGTPMAPGAEDDAVVLSTLHRAKGLQWRTIFVIGVSDGLVPLVTARSRAAREEERRLFYVALTRAEEELTCTWALRPAGEAARDGVADRRPSPWLTAVERALEELGQGTAEASPAEAAAHLAEMRNRIPRSPTGTDASVR